MYRLPPKFIMLSQAVILRVYSRDINGKMEKFCQLFNAIK